MRRDISSTLGRESCDSGGFKALRGGTRLSIFDLISGNGDLSRRRKGNSLN